MSIADPQHPSNRLLQLLDGTTALGPKLPDSGTVSSILFHRYKADKLSGQRYSKTLSVTFADQNMHSTSLFLFCLSSLYGSGLRVVFTASILHINLFYGVL